jgi:hypothetical protein
MCLAVFVFGELALEANRNKSHGKHCCTELIGCSLSDDALVGGSVGCRLRAANSACLHVPGVVGRHIIANQGVMIPVTARRLRLAVTA